MSREFFIVLEHRLQSVWMRAKWNEPRRPWLRPVGWLGDALYWTRRFFEGARRVDCSEPTYGSILEPHFEIRWSGMCPVQGEGELEGREVYYRSRGEGWQFHVAREGGNDVFADDAWTWEERLYFFPSGGYVSRSVSERCIRRAVSKWRMSGRP